mmetsp:Transcript_66820/g.118719  ORF Transcript_66820/g.118719 Transcript_66820/m.118719 type:complete len:174 (+) Transcript_66820:124-645(+)
MPQVVHATIVNVAPAASNNPSSTPVGTVVGRPKEGPSPPQPPAPVVMATVVQAPAVGTTVIGQPIGVARHQSHHSFLSSHHAFAAPSDPHAGNYSQPAEDPSIAAIVACFCCCWCIGIIAIIKAQEVSQANMNYDYARAHRKRQEAMTWIYLTIAAGIVMNLASFIISKTTRG